ncbi:hypothetical protein H5410_035138 [Solanum commersonii]|uniref:Uncharacterized protein n=1 Tax=Solanum commersonii TaxID=4109 RepID=A0A9J5Y1S3_SOLCO|nr:hypothetical protein H5410_035138 [Solanum commersonii]
MEEVRRKWFRHVKRRRPDALDMAQLQLIENMTLDQRVWRSRIRIEKTPPMMLPLTSSEARKTQNI